MKKVLVSGLVMLLFFGSCSTGGKNSFQGTWRMVQMQMVDRGKVTNYFSDRYKISQIKMWSGNQFMFVGKYEVDTLTTYRYGTGTFTLTGNVYVEDIEYHFNEDYEGKKNKIWLEVRNDTLFHIFPVDDKGHPIQSVHWIEKYVRLN